MVSVNYNGRFFDPREPVLEFDNRGFRYGDGLFETMRFQNGKVQLGELHMSRCFAGMSTLKFNLSSEWSSAFFINQIIKTCAHNSLDLARVRLTIHRGTGAVNDYKTQFASYLIETLPIPAFSIQLPEVGLHIGIYKDACKCYDAFANIKTNNYLVSVMGSLFAHQHSFDDCIILNQDKRVCEFTIGNLFWVKNNLIYTVPLTEAPIAGVIRKWILENKSIHGFEVREELANIETLMDADELFLTNSIAGIRWVQQFGSACYSNDVSSAVYRKMIRTIAG